MINILVVDDQNLTQKLIETYLEKESDLNIVGFANNGETAVNKVENLKPDVVLMDVEMPIMDGLTATEVITQKFVSTKVLILTVHDNQQHLSKALRSGAKGYLLKNTIARELANAIRYVNQGYFQLSLELTEKYLHRIVRTQPELEENIEFRKKLNLLHKALNKLGSKFQIFESTTKEHTSRLIEEMLQYEMSILKDHDSHLQFKVDRMKYSLERLEKNVSYLFKMQLACILLALLVILYFVIANFK